jgi:anthranilate synthase/aminodeoxychorismate synthase-like glutamine amidotransferase
MMNDDKNILEMNPNDHNGVVLSPGPGVPKNSGYLIAFIEKYFDKLPILGVCLGHQALGEFLGMKLEKALIPMHGKVSTIEHNGKDIFKDIINPVKVCRYHSLVLKNPSAETEVTAFTIEKEIMAFKHRILPLYGVQFHPEAILTNNGLEMIRNWLSQ